ncbi:hypothetical protein [Pseudomonas fluorescens]|uniref:Uncharacterized protein n=1 Tax=Pseudomonas fluorescens TaxID=294 RepID=A0A5E7EUR2_PSEFL|nr:hypothetical protein [Pseudomonas fluorescens]VVO30665.1 hypothetical protein PS723_04964 [Pseudomonas fluorescens]
MSKVNDTAEQQPMEIIDQAHFEKYGDAALILKCFEVMKDAIEHLDDAGAIELQDDTYVTFVEAYWALKVLFRRKTGGDAKKVSGEHWNAMGQHLLEGAELPVMHIPFIEPTLPVLWPAYLHQQESLALACMAYNSADNARLALAHTAPDALTTRNACVEALNATSALRALVLRLSGGTLEDMAGIVAKFGRSNGGTLQ